MNVTYFPWRSLILGLITLSYVLLSYPILAVTTENTNSKPNQTHLDHSQDMESGPGPRSQRSIIYPDYDQDSEFDNFRKTLRSTLAHIQSQKYDKAPSSQELECQGTARRLLHTLLGMQSIVPNDISLGEAATPPEISFDPKLNGTVSNLLLGMTQELTNLANCNPQKVSWAVQLLQPISSALNSQENQFQITSTDIEKILISQVRNNSDDLEEILGLAKEKFTVKQLRHLLEVLFVEKENQNKIRSLHFLMFARAVQSFSQSYTDRSDRREFDNLNLKIASPVIIILDSWADQIRRRNFASIVNYPKESLNAEKSFSYFLPKLIQAAYTQGGGVESVETLLEFARAFQSSEFMAAGYVEIFKQMLANKHVDNHYQISMLAFRVKEAMARGSRGRGPASALQALESTKSALPPSIRRLVFDEHKYVIIESAAYPSYTLYASTWRNIYTYPHYNYAGGNNQKWKVYNIQEGRYFAFENIQTGKVLAEYGNKMLETVSMTFGDYKKQWRIFPINNGTHVYFRNRETGNYLSGGNFQKCGVSSRTGLRTKPNTFVNKYSSNQEWTIIY